MYPDNEIYALNSVYEALKGLTNAQIKRILEWITGKFDLDKQPGLKSLETEAASQPAPGPLPVTLFVETAAPSEEPIKKRRGRRPGKAKTTAAPQKKRRGRRPGKAVEEKPGPQPAAAPVIMGLIKYDNFEELLLFSTAKTNTAKILLAAVYLQENKNYKEFVSYDISALFKEIGEEIGQPSPALSYLMSKKPPLVIQTGTEGPGLKARRKFRVTEEGLRIAGNYIKE